MPAPVVVHAMRVDLTRPVATSSLALLDDDERDRLARFTSEPAARRFAASHAFLRTVLADALGVAPASLRYERSCEHCGHPSHGRPRLAGPAVPVDFSLSHSGSVVVVAVGPGPLGVDVEDLARRPVAAGVVARSATAAEQARLPPAGSPGRHRAVLELWTRKEAVAKALGLGVTLPFASFEAPAGEPITAGPSGSPSLVVWPVALTMEGVVASVAAPVGVDVSG